METVDAELHLAVQWDDGEILPESSIGPEGKQSDNMKQEQYIDFVGDMQSGQACLNISAITSRIVKSFQTLLKDISKSPEPW
jgi:hypothetical protein